ncbi:hypothetical protein Sango_1871000 [Sesamum angolense]|uniref:Uncharacterized protein n=1 Tax=Sesamum angolense TaxID=2727404 RepID=A0AAE1WIW7_9LAMI|nr:hypothetical protein Sango_1871000 [Sesamum angolense]
MGDRNTKFFHDMAKRNVAKNSILAITKSDGSTIMSAAEIGQEFVTYFTSLLGTPRAVTPLEVKQAIFHISDNKAPNRDGYSACFFKRAWHVVGDQVCTTVMNLFRSGHFLRQLNHNIIALVPKSKHCPTVADYLSISCCNSSTKPSQKLLQIDLPLPWSTLLTDARQPSLGDGALQTISSLHRK